MCLEYFHWLRVSASLLEQVGLQISDSPKPQNIPFIIIEGDETQKIFTFQEQTTVNVDILAFI